MRGGRNAVGARNKHKLARARSLTLLLHKTHTAGPLSPLSSRPPHEGLHHRCSGGVSGDG